MFDRYLVEAASKFPEVVVFQGQKNPTLMSLAQGHSLYMAERNKQSHDHFQKRYDDIKRVLNLRSAEICAESWPWITTLPEIAEDMFKSWQYSEGHWKVCTTVPKYWGASMDKGKEVWYACILVGY